MAITTYDGLVSAFNSGQTFMFLKAGPANQAAGGWTSLWRVGSIPTQPNIPTATLEICTKATLGAFNFASPSGTAVPYISRISYMNTVSHGVFLFDRIIHNGGLKGDNTGSISVQMSAPVSRGIASGGFGAFWFAEIYTDLGTTGTTLTANVTKSDGASADIALTWSGASPANRAGRLYQILPSGDYAISTIHSVRQTATTGVSGSFGIVLASLITQHDSGVANIGKTLDYAQLNLPTMASNSCIWFALLSGATAPGTIQGTFTVVNG